MRFVAAALGILVAAVASAAPAPPAAAPSVTAQTGAQSTARSRLMWSDGQKPTPQAISLLQELQRCADRGLDPGDYPVNRLADVLAGLTGAVPSAAAPSDPAQWAAFDAELGRAGLRLLSDLHYGRIDPATVGHNLTVDRVNRDLPAALERLATAADVPAALDALEPQFRHYALLKKQLSRYRALASEEGINALPPLPAKSVKPGEAYAGAAQLEHLLSALGDSTPGPAPSPPQSLTPALVDALKHFQSRHGEKPDGVLGRATFAQLTRPLRLRVRQIDLTMERWRWLPARLSSAPIIVNIPQFRLFAFESTSDMEAKIRQMDVIVGKAFHATQTPVFAADMTYLVFHPYWDVPYDIARKEIVPAARRDPESITRQHMEIVRGGGDSATVMPSTPENIELLAKGELRVRQKLGPDNSLGLVKFMLPNPYNVYLHGTPAQALFGESRRDFSHGCVRVSDPMGLAQYVLRDSPEWTRERILAAMNGEKPLIVPLKNHIRVFIVYGTAMATEQGNILFFDDIYGHDQRLEQALVARRAR